MPKPLKKQVSGKGGTLGLLHQLSERLAGAGNCLNALQHRAATATGHSHSLSTEVLDRALAQLKEAGEIVVDLRKALDGSSPADSGAGGSYRVCFMNRFARGRNTITACQRGIVIPAAESREAAIEAAKRRFAELEDIPDWTLHASFIEARLLEDDASAGCETQDQRMRRCLTPAHFASERVRGSP